ncbi:ATP-dependent DNA helicase, partial [Frankliniella fusca]
MYRHRYSNCRNDFELFTQMALDHIESILLQHNVCLAHFGLPSLTMTDDDLRLHTLVSEMEEEIALVDKAEEHAVITVKVKGNPEQLVAFSTIMSAVHGSWERGNLFYLKGTLMKMECTARSVHTPLTPYFHPGRGGRGKTFLLNTIILTCEMEGIPIQVSAFTGVAARLLKSGKTSHKVFGLSVKDSDEQLLGTIGSSISLQSQQAQRLREAKMIIWGEISMATALQLETVLLKEVTGRPEPFGNICVVLSGDFLQCLPVLPGKGRKDIVEAAIPSHSLWPEFQILRLEKIMRLNSDDEEFANWMVSVGTGAADLSGSTHIGIPLELTVESREDLIHHVFGDYSSPLRGDAAILCPRNDTVNELNEMLLDRISGSAVQNFNDVTLTPQYLESLNPSSLPFHRLHLRVGAILMLMRNMNFDSGLCNGTKLIIRGLGDNASYCQPIEGNGI